jgi:hypothetical protein
MSLILGDSAQIRRVRPQLTSDSHSFPCQLNYSVREDVYLFWPQPNSEHKQSNTPISHQAIAQSHQAPE